MKPSNMSRLFLSSLFLILVISLSGCFFDTVPPKPPEGWSFVDVTGTVMDVHHQPVPGAIVAINQGGKIVKGSEQTDPNGEYIFNDVLLEKGVAFYAGAIKTDYSTNFCEPMLHTVYNERAAVTQNIWLYRTGFGSIISISGTVRDTEGTPVNEATIMIQYAKPSGAGDAVGL